MAITWECHVCHEVRPDERISVLIQQRTFGRIQFTQYVRYCNDRPVCIEGARAVDFLPATIRATQSPA